MQEKEARQKKASLLADAQRGDVNAARQYAAMQGDLLSATFFLQETYIIHKDGSRSESFWTLDIDVAVKPKPKSINLFTAYMHYKNGNGEDYYVDISNLDFTALSISKDFNNEKGKQITVDMLMRAPKSAAGQVLGGIRVEYLGNGMIKVVDVFPEGSALAGQRYYDTYNFNVRWGDGFTKRNVATVIAGMVHSAPFDIFNSSTYGGTPYKIYFSGQSKISE